MAYSNGVNSDRAAPYMKELLVLEAQKTILEQRISHLRQNLTGRSGGSGPSLKRSASGPPAAKGAKRARQSQTDRVEALFSQCRKILTQLKKNSNSKPFQLPVNPDELKCYDYFDIVKKPMDLKTIWTKLKQGERVYATPLEFRDDVRQVFVNCRQYNPQGHVVRMMGDRLSDIFDKQWAKSGIEQQWNELQHPNEAVNNLGPPPAGPAAVVPEQNGVASHGPPAHAAPQHVPSQPKLQFQEIEKLQKELVELTEGASTAPPDVKEDSPMPFVQRRHLSRKLEHLPEERMGEVGKILSQCEAIQDGATETDLDSLDNQTLWRLQKLVDVVWPSGDICKTEQDDLRNEQGE